MKRFTRGISFFLMVILLVGLQGWSSAAVPSGHIITETVYPYPYRATWLETVRVNLPWTLILVDMSTVKVIVANREAKTTVDPLSNTASFELPERIWGGPQQFYISGVTPATSQTLILAKGIINVLGQSVFDEQNNPNTNNSTTNNPTPSIFFIFKPENNKKLPNLSNPNLELASPGIFLGGTETSTDKSPCNYTLYEAKSRTVRRRGITSAVLPVGQALEALEDTHTAIDVDGVLAVDPRPGDSLNPLSPGELLSSENAVSIDAKLAVGGGISSSEDTTIAILDSGISKTLATNPAYHVLEDSTSFLTGVDSPRYVDGFTAKGVNVGHGTAVAALASSISPLSKILSIKVCDHNGKCPLVSVVQGICYAINYAKSHTDTQMILNLSFGSDTPSHIIYTILKDAEKTFRYPSTSKKNDQPLIRVVSSSGNDWYNRTKNNGDLFHYPAALIGVKGLSTRRGLSERISSIEDLISVGAVGKDRRDGVFKLANFSNQGDYISLVAPGFNIISKLPTGIDYGFFTGTSFATPIVAGALALMSPSSRTQRNPASGTAIKQKLRSLVTPIYVAIENDVGVANLLEATGTGMLDLSQFHR
jgi:subtilisin